MNGTMLLNAPISASIGLNAKVLKGLWAASPRVGISLSESSFECDKITLFRSHTGIDCVSCRARTCRTWLSLETSNLNLQKLGLDFLATSTAKVLRT